MACMGQFWFWLPKEYNTIIFHELRIEFEIFQRGTGCHFCVRTPFRGVRCAAAPRPFTEEKRNKNCKTSRRAPSS
jgi:hypothetical protein